MHVCRGGVGVASLGGYLFAIGGHDGRTYLNTAEMYCPKFNTWTMVASMNTSRAGAGVVTCPLTSLGLKFMNSAPSRPESFGSLWPFSVQIHFVHKIALSVHEVYVIMSNYTVTTFISQQKYYGCMSVVLLVSVQIIHGFIKIYYDNNKSDGKSRDS